MKGTPTTGSASRRPAAENRARNRHRATRSRRAVGRRNRLRTAAARPAARQRTRLLRRARKRSPPQGQDPGKDVPGLRLQRHASSRSKPARSSPSSKSSWKPACGCRRSPAWPTTWPSPCACRASASSPRSPARTPSASKCPTNDRQLVRLREVIEETNGKAKKMRIPIFLGKDVAGNPLVVDLTTLPHLLDRRPHRHGQERLPELDHRLDADDAPARRSADADDRPQDGRAQPLQHAAAPDAPGRHRHAQGRGDSGLGRREDGRALPPAGPRPACGTSASTTSWAKKS